MIEIENLLKLVESEGKSVESVSGVGTARIKLIENGFYRKNPIYDDEIFAFCERCDFLIRRIGIFGWDNLSDCSGTPSDYQTVFARREYCPCAQINGVAVELFDKEVITPIK